jgi:16S rRNA (adenine(1408)-N(1))-methyltransferase
VAIDLGTGDGRFVVSSARSDRATLWIGVDASLDGLTAASTQAARPAKKGGAENAIFVHSAAESLPYELDGLATGVTVLLPWGSLLAAVARPDVNVLARIGALCAPSAGFRALFTIDPVRDAKELERLGLREVGTPEWESRFRCAYDEAGFNDVTVRPVPMSVVAELGTTWAKRIARTPGRNAWEIRARRPGNER